MEVHVKYAAKLVEAAIGFLLPFGSFGYYRIPESEIKKIISTFYSLLGVSKDLIPCVA